MLQLNPSTHQRKYPFLTVISLTLSATGTERDKRITVTAFPRQPVTQHLHWQQRADRRRLDSVAAVPSCCYSEPPTRVYAASTGASFENVSGRFPNIKVVRHSFHWQPVETHSSERVASRRDEPFLSTDRTIITIILLPLLNLGYSFSNVALALAHTSQLLYFPATGRCSQQQHSSSGCREVTCEKKLGPCTKRLSFILHSNRDNPNAPSQQLSDRANLNQDYPARTWQVEEHTRNHGACAQMFVLIHTHTLVWALYELVEFEGIFFLRGLQGRMRSSEPEVVRLASSTA